MTIPVLSHPGQCLHSWAPRDVLPTGEAFQEECVHCGSRCSRDAKTGLIVNYDRRVEVQPHKVAKSAATGAVE